MITIEKILSTAYSIVPFTQDDLTPQADAVVSSHPSYHNMVIIDILKHIHLVPLVNNNLDFKTTLWLNKIMAEIMCVQELNDVISYKLIISDLLEIFTYTAELAGFTIENICFYMELLDIDSMGDSYLRMIRKLTNGYLWKTQYAGLVDMDQHIYSNVLGDFKPKLSMEVYFVNYT